QEDREVLILAGKTRSYLDEVRYLSNYSSGSTGLKLATEFYCWGFHPSCVFGPMEKTIPSYLEKFVERVETQSEMKEVSEKLIHESDFVALFFAAAILDYECKKPETGKRKSINKNWSIELEATPKLIRELGLDIPHRVGFKLETKISEKELRQALVEAA